jgi:hypothetical protein
MKTCRNCGATLPDNALQCMQCGTPVDPPQAGPAAPLATSAFAGPAFLGGSIMGVLSSIPIVNCLCCAWIVGGGGFATWLVGRNLPRRAGAGALSYGDGAFAGVLTGVWGGIVATLVSIPLRMLSAQALEQARAQMETIFSENPEIPDTVREMILALVSQELSLVGVLVTLVLNLVFYGLFSMIGGILLVAILRQQSPR